MTAAFFVFQAASYNPHWQKIFVYVGLKVAGLKKEDNFYTYLKHFNTLTISWEDFIDGLLTNQSREILSEKANVRYKVKCRIQST